MTQPEAVRPLIDSGMTRQLEAFRDAIAGGMPRLGWKVAFNDPAVQQRLGLTATLVGWLDGRRVFLEGQPYQPRAGSKPLAEAEVAVRLSRDVTASTGLDQARAAIAAVAPAIEFANRAKATAPLDAMIADDILHDGVLFGPEAPLPAASGLVEAGFPKVAVNGGPPLLGVPGRYPEDLAEIVVHVANVLTQYGESLRAGDRIICGAYVAFDIASGDRVEADFGPLGKLSFTVA
nr:putative 2-oxo-hept-3-ene-1,7-dioate hydratase [uncultured bacterium]